MIIEAITSSDLFQKGKETVIQQLRLDLTICKKRIILYKKNPLHFLFMVFLLHRKLYFTETNRLHYILQKKITKSLNKHIYRPFNPVRFSMAYTIWLIL